MTILHKIGFVGTDIFEKYAFRNL